MEIKLVHAYNSNMGFTSLIQQKKIMEPTMEELINKTQLSPKIIPTSSRRLGGSSTESHFLHPTAVILLPRTRFAIITGINHTIQNYKGEFIIKRTKAKSK